jgi:hypothetical protein
MPNCIHLDLGPTLEDPKCILDPSNQIPISLYECTNCESKNIIHRTFEGWWDSLGIHPCSYSAALYCWEAAIESMRTK